jgi:hypothetical protein
MFVCSTKCSASVSPSQKLSHLKCNHQSLIFLLGRLLPERREQLVSGAGRAGEVVRRVAEDVCAKGHRCHQPGKPDRTGLVKVWTTLIFLLKTRNTGSKEGIYTVSLQRQCKVYVALWFFGCLGDFYSLTSMGSKPGANVLKLFMSVIYKVFVIS